MKIVNDSKLLTIFAKRSIVDVWMGSEYVSVFGGGWLIPLEIRGRIEGYNTINRNKLNKRVFSFNSN